MTKKAKKSVQSDGVFTRRRFIFAGAGLAAYGVFEASGFGPIVQSLYAPDVSVQSPHTPQNRNAWLGNDEINELTHNFLQRPLDEQQILLEDMATQCKRFLTS